ncbi:hypothetical protein E4U11_004496, partial [Claviceps purpurea]
MGQSGRCRLIMACYRRGKAKPHEAGDHEAGDHEAGDHEAGDHEAGESSVPRRRPGA